MDRNTKYFLIIFLGIPFVYLIYTSLSLDNNKTLVKGKFYKKVYWPKSGTNYKAIFNYKGYSYEASCNGISECTNYYFESKVKNREVYILIDSTNPKNNVILIMPFSYQENNLSYPPYLDSLIEHCVDFNKLP